MEREAQVYREVYEALVGAAYVLHQGEERSQMLLRAWSYYAVPLLEVLREEECHPVAYQAAQQLIGYLVWLHHLEDPEAYFRDRYRKRLMPRGLRGIFPLLRNLH